MSYVYSDEDNCPMNEEQWQAERAWAKEKAARKTQDCVEGLADMLELTGECVKCHHFVDLAEGFMDKNGLISNEQFDFLKMQCYVCGGNGKPNDQVEKVWDDLMEWVDRVGLRFSHCAWCPNVYRVYGKYKDPDDEWKAIEKLCSNCKYWRAK